MKQFWLTLILGSGATLALAAQPAEPPMVLHIDQEFIKEGKAGAHRKAEQAYVAAFRKADFPIHYIALSSEAGVNEVMFVESYPSFAAMEDADKLEQKTPLRSDLDAADAQDGELRSGSHSLTAVFRPDLSYLPEEPLTFGKTRYVLLATYHLRLGRSEDFQAGAKVILEGYKRAMLPTTVVAYEVVAGAPEGTYLFLEQMESLKDLDREADDQQALTNAVGTENFRRLMKGAGDVFEGIDTALYAVSPEMSYVSKATEDEDPDFWRPAPPPAPAAKTAKPRRKILSKPADKPAEKPVQQ
jgi:hypothetical protein